MKNILKIEELLMFFFSLYALYWLEASWWVYLLLLIAPDIGMIGYLGGNTVGATLYNLFHHKGIALVLVGLGFLVPSHSALITGIILFGHSSMDRMLGYGLKLKDGFKYTHLGKIGKE